MHGMNNVKLSDKQSTRYSRFILIKLEFYQQIFRKILISNFMKTPPVEAELFHADWQTDRQT